MIYQIFSISVGNWLIFDELLTGANGDNETYCFSAVSVIFDFFLFPAVLLLDVTTVVLKVLSTHGFKITLCL